MIRTKYSLNHVCDHIITAEASRPKVIEPVPA